MCLNIYIYIYIYICIHVCVCVFVFVYVCMHMCVYVYVIYIYIYMYIYIYSSVTPESEEDYKVCFMHICVCMHMCVCMHICVYAVYVCKAILFMLVCAHTYIHTHPSQVQPISFQRLHSVYMHAYIHTHIHTYIHTYIHSPKASQYHRSAHSPHTYIHTYIHTHTHTYIHTYTVQRPANILAAPTARTRGCCKNGRSIHPYWGCPQVPRTRPQGVYCRRVCIYIIYYCTCVCVCERVYIYIYA